MLSPTGAEYEWGDDDKMSLAFDEILRFGGITQDMVLESQRNPTNTMNTYKINSTVFTKENIRSLGFRNLVKQIRLKVGQTTQLPTCDIRLKNIDYATIEHQSQDSIQTLLSPFQCCKQKHSTTRFMLKNINAHFKPGTMTLIMGPPGCGKSTLLKLIAGLVKPHRGEELNGTITYNGCKANQVDLTLLTSYVQQEDHHFPMLTVQETLEFAHTCLVGSIDPDDPLTVNEAHMVDILISVFGLGECADTPIGDDMVRGVSGGQKRRVTVAEMLTGRAPVLLIDEFSNGLDASTTLDIAKSIQTMSELLEKTIVMSMLQPPPEVYELFDNIIVLDKGEMIFNGPRTSLPAYFHSIGYECPPRKDIADFLQEVTTSIGSRYSTSTMSTRRPINRREFAARFRESALYKDTLKYIDSQEPSSWQRSRKPVLQNNHLSFSASFHVVFSRMLKVSMRDTKFNKSRLVQSLVLGAIVGTVFLNVGNKATTPTEEAQLVPTKVSLFFLALLFQAVVTLSAIEAGISRRHVLYKQSAFRFYHVSSYALSEAALEWLWTLPQVILFCTPTYFGTGLVPNGFGMFTLIVYLTSLIYSQFFKLWTALSPDAVMAKVLSLFATFLHIMFSGYIMPGDSIPPGWIWMYWSNPMAWALRVLAQNEFLSSTAIYDTPIPHAGRVGNLALSAFGFSTNNQFIGGGIGFLVSFYCLELALTSLAYAYVRVRKSYVNVQEAAEKVLSIPFHLAHQPQPHETDGESEALFLEVKDNHQGINSLSFEPVTLAFNHIQYKVPVKKETRCLLNGVHGYFEPGTLTALMGSTGAGKTTLMDVISGRKTCGETHGEMYVNGQPLDRQVFNGMMGYCEQTDIHEETSTVYEAFTFSAVLRLPRGTSVDTRTMFVNDVIATLELESRSSAHIQSLTQGERKRVTIGVELLSNPSILFLDEPTTGLDSRAATIVMDCVKRIAQSGRTVVCTIHQPSTILFELFDKLLLLKSGGELVYFGNLGAESCEMLQYFEQFQATPSIKAGENPATYMLNCIGAGTLQSAAQVNFAQAYAHSIQCKQNEKWIESQTKLNTTTRVRGKQYHASFMTQLGLLVRRQWTMYWRSPTYNLSRIVLMLVLSLIFGSLYSGNKTLTVMDIVAQMVLIFMGVVFICVCMMSTSIPFTYKNRGVYYRERMSTMYSSTAYALSIFLVELVYACALASLYFHGWYWFVGLNSTPAAWLCFWLILCLSMALWSYIGHLLVFALPTMQVAVLLAGGSTALLFVFSGYMINGNTLTKAWKWMYAISPLHYTLEALIMTQYHNDTRLVSNMLTYPPTKVTVEQFVQDFFAHSFVYDNCDSDILYLVLILLILQLLIWFCLTKVCHSTR